MKVSRSLMLAGATTIAAVAVAAWYLGWSNLWASPDQRGRYLFNHHRYAEASAAFLDPMWRGVAQARAGDFKAAEASFAEVDTAEGSYNQANALVMLGKYDDAVKRYDRALTLRPGWNDATANRRIAQLRADRMKAPGADAGDQREGADQIVYDKDAKNPEGQDTQTTGNAMDDQTVRSLWLKSVHTKPADFLRARFAYQLETQAASKDAKPAETEAPQ